MQHRTGQAQALLDYLTRRPTASTAEIRRMLDCGNISKAASTVNTRLAAAGDERRVVAQHRGRQPAVWTLGTPDVAA
jgi:hypothetical protein